MNKKILLSIMILSLFFGFGCSRKTTNDNYLMDELASDNKYHYSNKDLGFLISFPEQFIYYQTQRKNLDNSVVIEYFVPTNDLEYPQEVPSYGKFLSVMIYDNQVFEEISDEQKEGFEYFGEKDEKVYLGLFWSRTPSDWQDRWSDSVKEEIKSSFKIIK